MPGACYAVASWEDRTLFCTLPANHKTVLEHFDGERGLRWLQGYGKVTAGPGTEADVWAFAAKRPTLYRLASAILARLLKLMGGKRGNVRAVPVMNGWFVARNFPAPQGKTFHEQWKAR